MPFSRILSKLKSFATHGTQGMEAGPRVLLYHRVFTPDRDPQLLSVSPAAFRAQMQWLKENCSVLPLSEMALHARNCDLPANAVSVTFDDGYFDNLEFAKPVLVELEIPATVFVSSGFVGSGIEMWWDELEAILLSDEPREWNVTMPATTERQRQYLAACAELKFAAPADRRQIFARLAVRGEPEASRGSHRGLTKAELVELARGPFVEVGGHTVDHPALSRMSRHVQRDQIEVDKLALEQILSRPVRTFAYPFGTQTEVDALTENLVRDVGYELACANVSGSVRADSGMYRIPRELVRNWDVPTFAARMSSWLRG